MSFDGYAKKQHDGTYAPVLILKRVDDSICYVNTQGKLVCEKIIEGGFEKIINNKTKSAEEVTLQSLPFEVGMFVCLTFDKCQTFFCNCQKNNEYKGGYGIIKKIDGNFVCVKIINNFDLFYKYHSNALLSEYMKSENEFYDHDKDSEISEETLSVNYAKENIMTITRIENLKPSFAGVCNFFQISTYLHCFDEITEGGQKYLVPKLELEKNKIKEEKLMKNIIQHEMLTW